MEFSIDHTCGTAFDVADARNEYNTEEEFNGELDYDEDVPDRDLCGACAVAWLKEAIEAGLQMDFSLKTGLPPEDMPDDWEMSSDD